MVGAMDEVWTHWVDARRACAILDVKRRTLYSYVSQGRIRSAPVPGSRKRRYAIEDVMHLRDRARARSGHGPVAATALDWGEPVLDTAICAIEDEGPVYRGHAALELARSDVRYEAVAELLMEGALPESAEWKAAALPEGLPDVGDRVGRFLARLACWRAGRKRLSIAAAFGPELIAPAVALLADDPRAVPSEGTMAERLLGALGGRTTRRAAAATNRALVVCAEHELNASAFPARIAASAAADPIAVVLAALATHTGARHGGVSGHVGVLLDSTTPERAASAVRSWIRRGELASLPGFGHRLYAGGDPRGTFLLEEAEALAPRRKAVRTARALVEAAEAAGYEPPNLDLGLTALGHALGVGPKGGQAIFAIGRMAGWLAHAREQFADGRILRPRARFVGGSEDTPS